MQPWVTLQFTILLMVANGTPNVVKDLLGDRLSYPLDGRFRWVESDAHGRVAIHVVVFSGSRSEIPGKRRVQLLKNIRLHQSPPQGFCHGPTEYPY